MGHWKIVDKSQQIEQLDETFYIWSQNEILGVSSKVHIETEISRFALGTSSFSLALLPLCIRVLTLNFWVGFVDSILSKSILANRISQSPDPNKDEEEKKRLKEYEIHKTLFILQE